jgi:hypothetical protein
MFGAKTFKRTSFSTTVLVITNDIILYFLVNDTFSTAMMSVITLIVIMPNTIGRDDASPGTTSFKRM